MIIKNRIIPAIIAPIFPRKHRIDTIAQAIKTPREIAKKDKKGFSPKIKEAKAPVQAPVVGKGIPTNIIKPKISYLSIILLFFWVLEKSQSKNFLNKLILVSRLTINFKRKRIGKMGKRLPITDKRTLFKKGR